MELDKDQDKRVKGARSAGQGGGQGRGRTADLPIFRTTVQCPSPIGTVRDQRRNSFAIVGGRPRTNRNETEIETAREPRPTAVTRRQLSPQLPSPTWVTPQPRWQTSRP
jgi:hypothetical protein